MVIKVGGVIFNNRQFNLDDHFYNSTTAGVNNVKAFLVNWIRTQSEEIHGALNGNDEPLHSDGDIADTSETEMVIPGRIPTVVDAAAEVMHCYKMQGDLSEVDAAHEEDVIIDGYFHLGDNMVLCESEDNIVYFPCM
ncbi:unnamed protein product [Hermetia illucens]|uniref:Uncharacterized protein n=1 Tax=Hermetia illucens TaxID=343691 RepID=A0A7R8UP00_HERIL|nr:unnamed protein product [Hermetia illucens]